MKSITRLSLALIMFSLFSISYLVTSVSADMYNPPPNPSNDPRNTMKSESVDLNKQTLQLHKRITELEQQLNEERAQRDNFYADLLKDMMKAWSFKEDEEDYRGSCCEANTVIIKFFKETQSELERRVGRVEKDKKNTDSDR